jgi:hypothetical protein
LPRPLSSKVPTWFGRKFDFAFPADQYPNVFVRLWGRLARLEEILRKVTTDVLIGKPQEKWSAQEHAGHLLDLEPLWMARVDDFLTERDTLAVADLGNCSSVCGYMPYSQGIGSAREVARRCELPRQAEQKLLAYNNYLYLK